MGNPTIESMNQMRDFLREDLVDKCKNRSGYSLKSFARFLDVEPSNLSKILNGKKDISKLKFNKFLKKINQTPERLNILDRLNTKYKDRKSASALLKSCQPASEEQASTLSNWYHSATLELAKASNFKSNISFVSKYLNVSVTEVKLTVDRLLKYNDFNSKDH